MNGFSVIFVVICVYFTCYHLIFNFFFLFVWFTLSTQCSEMFKGCSQIFDMHIDW